MKLYQKFLGRNFLNQNIKTSCNVSRGPDSLDQVHFLLKVVGNRSKNSFICSFVSLTIKTSLALKRTGKMQNVTFTLFYEFMK